MRQILSRVLMLSAVGVGLLQSSCIILAKGDVQVPSTGRALLDLKEARKAGLITEVEYQQQRVKILEKSKS